MELLAGIIMAVAPFLWNGIDYYNQGKYCVNTNVQVGDLVQTKDGSRLEVTEVQGPSIFCRNAELPIKVTVK